MKEISYIELAVLKVTTLEADESVVTCGVNEKCVDAPFVPVLKVYVPAVGGCTKPEKTYSVFMAAGVNLDPDKMTTPEVVPRLNCPA